MKFIDSIKIKVKAGNGGNGALSFFQDWQQVKPRADGGNGGNGADIVFVSSNQINTLLHLKSKQFIKAPNGSNGDKTKKNGKCADTIIIKIPVGSIIFSSDKKYVFFDFKKEGQKFTIVKGGRGGRGNAFFVSNTNRYGKKAENGFLGEYREIRIELKLLADIGLIGLPNAGKSSLLKILTNANPQIANYEFTTLTPNLGILIKNKKRIVIADLPGIIEGAHKNKGLGNIFLRHTERCLLLIHVIDLNLKTNEEFDKNYKLIKNEISQYDRNLSKLPTLIVGNKIDLKQADFLKDKLFNKKEINDSKSFIFISIKENININLLIDKIFEFYEKNKKNISAFEKSFDEKYKYKYLIKFLPHSEIRLKKLNKGIWELSGPLFEKILDKYDIDSEEGLKKINDFFEKKEIKETLKFEGIKNKDTVILNNKYFEWKD